MTSKLYTLYRLYDEDGTLSDHSRSKPWWPDVAWITLENLSSAEELDKAEHARMPHILTYNDTVFCLKCWSHRYSEAHAATGCRNGSWCSHGFVQCSLYGLHKVLRAGGFHRSGAPSFKKPRVAT